MLMLYLPPTLLTNKLETDEAELCDVKLYDEGK
jgi:hypothetical protein